MNILDKFPKERIELPEAYKKIYLSHYLSNREGKYMTTSLSRRLESWMHRKVAEDLSGKNAAIKNAEFTTREITTREITTLEIGAGTLNHLKYEPEGRAYHIVEPFTELFEASPQLARIQQVYSDISEVPAGNMYDRITSVATFEHLIDLPLVVAAAARHLKEGGHLRVAIPNEGTIMWTLGTKLTGYEFKKKYGLDYHTLMRYEHVNTAQEVEEVLKYFFGTCQCSVFGLSRAVAFYRFYDCSEPHRQRISVGCDE